MSSGSSFRFSWVLKNSLMAFTTWFWYDDDSLCFSMKSLLYQMMSAPVMSATGLSLWYSRKDFKAWAYTFTVLSLYRRERSHRSNPTILVPCPSFSVTRGGNPNRSRYSGVSGRCHTPVVFPSKGRTY